MSMRWRVLICVPDVSAFDVIVFVFLGLQIALPANVRESNITASSLLGAIVPRSNFCCLMKILHVLSYYSHSDLRRQIAAAPCACSGSSSNASGAGRSSSGSGGNSIGLGGYENYDVPRNLTKKQVEIISY